MIKKIYSFIIIFFSLFFISVISVQAVENNLVITSNGVVASEVYPLQWDVEVLDFTLMPSENDILNALTIRSIGSAPYSYFEKVVLYADDGDGIFEGWKLDQEIGTGISNDFNQGFYWKDLNIIIPKAGQRFFVAIETKKNMSISSDRRTIQFGISEQYDANKDGVFDLITDTGVYMDSKNNGPASGVFNLDAQTIYKKSIDVLAPKIVMAYPAVGGKISDQNVIITGFARDQGGSSVNSAQINISKAGAENTNWVDVAAVGTSYSEWNFNWNNIEDGVYTIKIKAIDSEGNSGEEEGMTVIVDTAPIPTPAPMPIVSPTPTPSLEESQIIDGDLIQVKNTFDIYIVKIVGAKKFKRLILNPEIFNSYGHLKWENVKEVLQATADNYAVSDLVIEANEDGSIADPKVYRVSSAKGSDVGEKRWLNVSSAQFEAAGLDWDSLYKINSTEASANFYPKGIAIIDLNL